MVVINAGQCQHKVDASDIEVLDNYNLVKSELGRDRFHTGVINIAEREYDHENVQLHNLAVLMSEMEDTCSLFRVQPGSDANKNSNWSTHVSITPAATAAKVFENSFNFMGNRLNRMVLK